MAPCGRLFSALSTNNQFLSGGIISPILLFGSLPARPCLKFRDRTPHVYRVHFLCVLPRGVTQVSSKLTRYRYRPAVSYYPDYLPGILAFIKAINSLRKTARSLRFLTPSKSWTGPLQKPAYRNIGLMICNRQIPLS